MGQTQQALGDLSGASRAFERSLQIREKLVALTGESPQALRDLAVSWVMLAGLDGSGEPGGNAAQQAKQIFERLVAAYPQNAQYRQDLANVLTLETSPKGANS